MCGYGRFVSICLVSICLAVAVMVHGRESQERRQIVQFLKKQVKRIKGMEHCSGNLNGHAEKVARSLLRKSEDGDMVLFRAQTLPEWITVALVQRLWMDPGRSVGTAGDADAGGGQEHVKENLGPNVENAPVHAVAGNHGPADAAEDVVVEVAGNLEMEEKKTEEEKELGEDAIGPEVKKKTGKNKTARVVANRKVAKRLVNSRAFDIWKAEQMAKERSKHENASGKRLKKKTKQERAAQKSSLWRQWQDNKSAAVRAPYFAKARLGGQRRKDRSNRWRRVMPASHFSDASNAEGAITPHSGGPLYLKRGTMHCLLRNMLSGLHQAFPPRSKQGSEVLQVLSEAFRKTGLSKRTASQMMSSRVPFRLWSGTKGKKRGRPKGSCKMVVADLRELFISSHCAPSCEVSLRWGDVLFNLTKSIARAWREDVQLQVYKPNTLQRKLRNCKLGITKLKRRSDCCQFCIGWSSSVAKSINHTLTNFFKDVAALLPAYTEIWEAALRGHHPEWLGLPENALENPAFYRFLRVYMETQAATYPTMRQELEVEKRQRLEKLEGDMLRRLTGENSMEDVVSYISWHWSIKEWTQELFWKNWYTPEDGTLYLLFDYKENGTLPQGPAATALEWRANARLGYTVFGVCCWRKDWHKWYFYVTTCMEHTTAATTCILDDLWLELEDQLQHTTRIRTWSDGGTHFRSNAFLAYMGVTIPNQLKKDTAVAYGVVNHFKNPCDGEFGGFSDRVEQAAAENVLSEVDFLVERLRIVDVNANHVYKNFFPPKKADVAVERLKRNCLPCGIHSSHFWQFQIIDRRRVSLAGRVAKNGRPFTGINAKASMLPGIRSIPEANFEPVLEFLPEGHQDSEGSDEEEDKECEKDLEIETHMQDGWRISWRKIEPEKVCPKKWKASLKRKYDAMGAVHDSIPLAARRKTVAVKLGEAVVRRDRKKFRAKFSEMEAEII